MGVAVLSVPSLINIRIVPQRVGGFALYSLTEIEGLLFSLDICIYTHTLFQNQFCYGDSLWMIRMVFVLIPPACLVIVARAHQLGTFSPSRCVCSIETTSHYIHSVTRQNNSAKGSFC